MFDVVPITLAISLLLVAVFVYFFWREHSQHRFNSAETDALLPLADEKPHMINRVSDDTAITPPATTATLHKNTTR